MAARRIAFFGRPGVGTSTIVANIGAALAEAGRQVAVVGCDAGGRTTASLRQGKRVIPLLEVLRQTSRAELLQVAVTGFKGTLCLELGKLVEDVEASVALSVINDLLTDGSPQVEYVLYNATGDAGDPETFVAPLLRNRQIDQVVAVSTAEVDGLRAVNHLLRLLRTDARDNLVEIGGIIGNNLSEPYAEAIIDSFARATTIPVAAFIPQSLVVIRSAFFNASVIDAAPLAHHAYLYRKTASILTASRLFSQRPTPHPLDEESFHEWSLDWGERLFDLGEGYVGTGGAI
jgi:nitrogenase iron protein NifH